MEFSHLSWKVTRKMRKFRLSCQFFLIEPLIQYYYIQSFLKVFCIGYHVDNFYFVWCTLYSLTVVQCVLYPKWLAIYSNILTSHHWVRGWITLQETSSSSSAQWCSSVSITICKHCHRYNTTDIIPHIIGKPSKNFFPKGNGFHISAHHLDLDF